MKGQSQIVYNILKVIVPLIAIIILVLFFLNSGLINGG